MKRLAAVLSLSLLFSFSSWAQGLSTYSAPEGFLIVSVTEWNGFKLSYAQLIRGKNLWASSLQESAEASLKLKTQLALVSLDLHTANNLLSKSSTQLQTAMTQNEWLKGQLLESLALSTELKRSISRELRRQMIKGIGYGVGGTIVIGLVTWGVIELVKYIRSEDDN